MRLPRPALVLGLGLLAACGGAPEPRWAPDAELAKYTYQHDGSPELRLYTVVSTRNGSGAHTALLVSTPRERILFDPAGTFRLPFAPERNDVHHGITPRVLAVYIDYHARESFDVIEQRVALTRAQSEQLAAAVKSYGAVPKAQCTLSSTRILRQVDGFKQVPATYFPTRAKDAFAALPGVSTRVISDNDTDQNEQILARAAGR